MTRLALLTGALLLAAACTPEEPAGETGTETETTTETSGDGDGDGECAPPPGVYADCSAGLAACMAEGGPAQCLQDDPNTPSISVCGRPCADACDCWAAPADGEAPVACKSLVVGDDGTCVLDCAAGQSCPSGMSCNEALGICVFSL